MWNHPQMQETVQSCIDSMPHRIEPLKAAKVRLRDENSCPLEQFFPLLPRHQADYRCSRVVVAGFVTSLSPVPLKTRRVGQRCRLNLSRPETSSRWCGS
ncbi:hypothetical protein TNCV_228281 [Trichonephila clavipes]|nr:hypothetical protein TNCV_228281 [Trichonephila clavipes]